MNILAAGGGGYIGIPLLTKLLAEGYSVTVLDMFYFGEEKISGLRKHNNFHIIKKDIRSVGSMDVEGIDLVIDLAGLSNDTAAEQHFPEAESINYFGCLHLAELASRCGVKRFIYSSSASVYGAGNSEYLTETSPLNPISKYAVLKQKTEAALMKNFAHKLEITILRNPTLFGISPRMRFDLALNIMTWCALRDGKITVHGTGKQWRPMLSVDDMAAAFSSVIRAPSNLTAGEIFNVGGNNSNITILDLARKIKKILPDTELIFKPEMRDGRSYHLNFDKITNRLGFCPENSPEDGIRSVSDAIRTGKIDPADPTYYTAEWYHSTVFPQVVNLYVKQK